MNKWEKEVAQHQLAAEEAVIKELEAQYKRALKEINLKIRILQSDELTQSKIYQINYQEALKGQIEGILEKLHGDEYTSIQQYLKDCYTDGFVGTMYDIAGQGIPLMIPIDQNAAVKAIMTDSKINEGLYKAIGVDTAELKKRIRSEITRGIAANDTYESIAQSISLFTNAPLKRARTIVRTEGHRIQQASTEDARQAAKKRGCDILKVWDATLDGDTRPTHRKLDGQIRETDEFFEMDGKKAKYPGEFGRPEEDCNCRCTANSIPRWALDEAELEEQKERAKYFGIDKTKDFEEYKEKYLKAADSQAEYLRNNMPKGYKETRKIGEPIKQEELTEIIESARLKGVQIGYDGYPLGGFDTYRGDVEVLKAVINQAAKQLDSELFKNAKGSKMILVYDNVLGYGDDKSMVDIGAFAMTKGRTITLNKFMFDDSAYLKKEYAEAVEKGFFVKGTDYTSIVSHEAGHIIDKNTPGLRKRILAAIEKEAANQGMTADEYISANISTYAADLDMAGGYHELVSELNSLLTSGGDCGIIEVLRKAGVF